VPVDEPDATNVLFLGYGEDQEDEDGFTNVVSRRSRKKRKSVCKKAARRE
jgi:hypothetical protein